MPELQNANLSKIIKRLELIKSLISLEEEDDIDAHILRGIIGDFQNSMSAENTWKILM